MGYKNFQVPKTIYLPAPYVQMTIQEYKNAYGIDLLDFFEIEVNTIDMKESAFKNVNVYIVADGSSFSQRTGTLPLLEKAQTHYDENDPDSYASGKFGIWVNADTDLSGLKIALSHADGLDITKATVALY